MKQSLGLEELSSILLSADLIPARGLKQPRNDNPESPSTVRLSANLIPARGLKHEEVDGDEVELSSPSRSKVHK